MERISVYQLQLLCEVMKCPLGHKDFLSMYNWRSNGRLVSDIQLSVPKDLSEDFAAKQAYDLMKRGFLRQENNSGQLVFKLTQEGEDLFEEKIIEFFNSFKTDYSKIKGYHFVEEQIENLFRWVKPLYELYETKFVSLEYCYERIESPFIKAKMMEIFNLKYFLDHDQWPEGYKTKNNQLYTQGELTKEGLVMLSENSTCIGKLVFTKKEFKYFYFELNKF